MTGPARPERHLAAVPADQAWSGGSAFDTEEPAIETIDAGIRYRRHWALTDCSVRIPSGSVVAVVGRNGSGKTTLLQMLAGLRRPTTGAVTVLGESVWPARAGVLARVGFVAQDKPLYGSLRVADLLRMGQRMNPSWDQDYAISRLRDRGVPFDLRIGKMSGGQRSQVALVMALAKRPSVVLLDEPLSDLDPVARREVMGTLMADLAEREVTVVLSSHSMSDLSRACDWLVLVDDARIRLADPIDVLLDEHHLLIGPVADADRVAQRQTAIVSHRGHRQAVLVVRGHDPALDLDPRWTVQQPTLEDLVFAYLNKPPL